jgi:A/G-specific adenine glycosylase
LSKPRFGQIPLDPPFSKGEVGVERAVRFVRRALLAWYDEHRRPLPWRRDRDPYKVWVAEVMLQQTRLQVAVPAYRRFLRAFPTLPRLARADEESVLSLWSGLGYYSRARALHRAARALHERGAASFPSRMDEALALPGVGPYTAAAVLSIAFDQPLAAVDGNVTRVLSRLRRLPLPDAAGEPHHSLAGRLLDRRHPGDWNQAMMELGETLCLPRAPRCGDCPVRRHCEADRHDEVALYPRRRARRATERVGLRLTLLRDRGGRLLLERGSFSYLPHLWLPPIDLDSDGGRRPQAKGADKIGTFRHTILHRVFEVDVHSRILAPSSLQRLARPPANGAPERRLFDRVEIERIGRSSLLTKALKLL